MCNLPSSQILSKAMEETKLLAYFESAVLGSQLLLELGDLAGGIFPKLGKVALKSLNIFNQLSNFSFFGGQFYFQAGSC